MKYFPSLFCLALLLLTSACDRLAGGGSGASIFVMSDPEGAVVECDGAVIGTGPVNITNLAAGEHLLVVRKEGYETFRKTVDLLEREKTVEEVKLAPLRGLLQITTFPDGAAVDLDGAFIGNAPLMVPSIPLGEHTLRVTANGYSPKEVAISIDNRIPKGVMVDLVSNSGSLVLHSVPMGARVFVDGRDVGPTPATLDRVEKGTRDVRLELAGYEPYRAEILVSPGEISTIDARMVPIPGSLKVVSIPGAARVYVDDVFRGDTPLTLSPVTPGTYVVRAELRGYATENRTVTVSRGTEEVLEFRMERSSGTLEIITRPAGVKVYVDSEFLGETTARGTDAVSEPLKIDLLSQGPHTLQLVRKGFSYAPKRFMIGLNQVTTLDETLDRLFIPNSVIRIGAGKDQTYTGVLVRKHLNGDIEMEISEGIFRTFPAREIVSFEALQVVENPEAE